ncbi:hypothetical protein JTE90_022626 [Oedothorax gibbosus]|uniref:Uncharacterized protein n=1 Tax=Oedothorax gibbosus TaxID=931172 RepID=A0AAV6TUA9_9ARAC|nr:hypothetical protein JTE90_022626 [Oedothorax gibbosus]
MYRYPDNDGWHYFYFPRSFLGHQDGTHFYEMIVLRRGGDLFFFSNSVAWCLGHSVPHEAVEQNLRKEKLLSFDNVGGYFLDEDGVLDLVYKSDEDKRSKFLEWFVDYLQNDS